MRRGLGAVALTLLLLFSSGCGWTDRSVVRLGLFKEKPKDVCSLSEVREYDEALEIARSLEAEAGAGGGEAAERPRFDEGVPTVESIVHKFVIRNTSKAPLKIERVVLGCGGSVGRYDQSIPPGKEGVITVTWNPAACSEGDMKFAIVVSDDPQRPAVVLKSRPAKGS